MKRCVWTACLLALAACQPPPLTKEELLAKWGPSYPACLLKYAGADGATPPELTAACMDQFERSEQIYTGLDTELRINAPDAAEPGAMKLTAANPAYSGRTYRRFTVRIIFYPNTVTFLGEAGARKTHEEFWTIEATLAPGQTQTFTKQPERPLVFAKEYYFHFANAAKFVSLK